MNGDRRNFIDILNPLNMEIDWDLGNTKSGNENYHVFVNGSYVGDRESISQGDGGPSAVIDYLKSRGFENLDIQNEGDNIMINTQDSEEAENLRRHLTVYLNIR